jgi:hypothetical protein
MNIHRGVAGLQRKCVDEQVKVDDIALRLIRVGEGGVGEPVLPDKRSVDVVQQVGPHLPGVCNEMLSG